MTHISPSYFSNTSTTQSAGNAFKTRMEPGYYSQSSRLSLGMIPPATDVFFSGKAQAPKMESDTAKKPAGFLDGLKKLVAAK